jgi:hypothetical protein
MALLHFRFNDRRRTVRVGLSVPLKVFGQAASGEKFAVPTDSQSVSLHGASFAFQPTVVLGQILVLSNEVSREKIECKVASIRHARDGKTYVGVEFTCTGKNFWHMVFPTPGARPLRRRRFPQEFSA